MLTDYPCTTIFCQSQESLVDEKGLALMSLHQSDPIVPEHSVKYIAFDDRNEAISNAEHRK